MTVLDSSVIIGYLDDEDRIVEYVDEETTAPCFTSAICVYEVLMGPVKSDQSSSLVDEREAFGWVRSLDLNEQIAVEANRMQDRLTDEGAQMSSRDILIAATARSTRDELVVADRDFDAERLSEFLDVVQLVEE
jgi:predicted nucleic acid-binding protein